MKKMYWKALAKAASDKYNSKKKKLFYRSACIKDGDAAKQGNGNGKYGHLSC